MDGGPVAQLFACWEAGAVAVLVGGTVEAVKRGLDWRVGRDRRENARALRLAISMLPIVLGAVIAMIVPIRPAWLTEYVRKLPSGRLGVFAVWGATIGLFSGFAYGAARQFVGRRAAERRTIAPTPVAHDSEPGRSER